MHKDIVSSSEFSEEMGNLIDIKKFKPQIANLILSMIITKKLIELYQRKAIF